MKPLEVINLVAAIYAHYKIKYKYNDEVQYLMQCLVDYKYNNDFYTKIVKTEIENIVRAHSGCKIEYPRLYE